MGKTRRREKTFNDDEMREFDYSIGDSYTPRKKRRNKVKRHRKSFPEVHGCYDERDEDEYNSFERIEKRK